MNHFKPTNYAASQDKKGRLEQQQWRPKPAGLGKRIVAITAISAFVGIWAYIFAIS